MIAAIVAIVLGCIAVFLGAPVVPVHFSDVPPRCAASKIGCTIFVCGWTEWESPSYFLLNFGYHYRPAQSNCQ